MLRPLQVDLLTLKLVNRVTCDVAYLCANFGLPRPLCSRHRPDVRDRQTSDRQTSDAHHRLVPSTIWAGEKVYMRYCTKSVRQAPWIARY